MATTNTLTNSGLYINTIYSLSDPSSGWIDFTNPGNVGINGNLSVSDAVTTSSIMGTYSVGNLNNQSSLYVSGGNNTTASSNPVLYLTDTFNVGSLMCICNSGSGNYNPIVQTGDTTIISNWNSLQQNANLDICAWNSSNTANGVQINSNSTTLWGDTTYLLVNPSGIVANGNFNVNGNIGLSGSIDASGGTVTCYNVSCNNTVECQYANISSANINTLYCPSISNVNTMYCATNGTPASLNIFAGNSADAGSNPAIRISNMILPGQSQTDTNWIQHVCNSSVGAWNAMVNTGDNSIISNANLTISVWSDISGNTYNNGLQITNNSTTLWGDTTNLLVNPSGIIADGNLDVTGNAEISGNLSVSDGITTSSINGTSSIDGNTDNSCLLISGGNSATSSPHPVLYLTDLSGMGSLMCICNSGAGNYNPIVQTGDNTIISNWNSQQPNVNLDICVWNSSDTANGVQITNNSTTLWGDTTSLSVNPSDISLNGNCAINSSSNTNSLSVTDAGVQITTTTIGGTNINGNLNVNSNANTYSEWLSLTNQYVFDTELPSNVTSIAASSTGQYITAVVNNTTIYTSSNYGVLWTFINVSYPCTSVSMSNSGQYQIIATNANTTTQNPVIYYSTNYGENFNSVQTINIAYCVAVSPDGTYFMYTSLNTNLSLLNTYIASTNNPTLYSNIISNAIGVNGFLTYFSNSITNGAKTINISCTFNPPNNISSIIQYFFNSWSSNSDGSYIGTYTLNPIYIAPNSPSLKTVLSNAMSNNGQYWIICDYNNHCVWTSTTYGNTFVQSLSSVILLANGCSMNSSGKYQTVTTTNGIYFSTNYGTNFALYVYSNPNLIYSTNISGNSNYYVEVTNTAINVFSSYGSGTISANLFSTNYISLPPLSPYNIGYNYTTITPTSGSNSTLNLTSYTNNWTQQSTVNNVQQASATIYVPGIYTLIGGFIGSANGTNGGIILLSITTNSSFYSNVAFQTVSISSGNNTVTGGNLSTVVSISSIPTTYYINFAGGTQPGPIINNFQSYLQYIKIA